ncbi:PAS domain-containing hybrid sensor histidine kinase/response regulator [Gemmatimonas phototrophica]|uniref:PAS domain-containing hybrid sensor histidine kinase/response regulator n=1 Tax=Gemmatimonas phototrophica TaxID=1379270 RepID=UPI000A9FE4CE|nr:PAS domain-containing sensor histidine kinase [Gemmatimonas phototrophica]
MTASDDAGIPPFRPMTPEQVEMLELSPNPKLVLDRQFRIRFVNRATAAYASIDREALVGLNVWDCYPTLRDSIFHQAYQRVLDTGTPARFERHDLTSDRWESVYAYPADDGVIAVLEDVTEQRRNVERLRDSEETLRLAQEAANLGSFHLDLRTDEAFWSDQLIRICGLDPAHFDQARIRQTPRLDFVHPEDSPLLREAWRTAITTGETQRLKHRIRRSDGAERHLLTHIMLVRDEDGVPARVVGTSLDISDQVAAELEHQRQDAQMQQAQKLESLGVLAGGIAHDFNNLLVGILGNASLAQLEVHDNPAARESLLEIEHAAQRAAELTRQLLAYAGKGRYVIEAADVTSSIKEMSALLRSAIARSAELEMALSPELPRIDVDLNQFRQVVLSLVTNASDALQEQVGTVQIITGRQQVTPEYLATCVPGSVATPGPYVFVEVRDSGSGMDAVTIRRMFEPFFSTKFTGRGLGLAAAMGILRAHRGAIRVYSELGVGTTVKLLFPARDAGPTSNAPVHGWRHDGHVLLIDDEASVRNVASALLRKRGFRVTEAVDGADGLARFSAQPDQWSLVMLDLTMPVMNGEQTLPALRAVRPSVPVLMMSGYNESDVKRNVGHQVGFLQKPFNADELYEAVRALIA